jgi:hypothetical protein
MSKKSGNHTNKKSKKSENSSDKFKDRKNGKVIKKQYLSNREST